MRFVRGWHLCRLQRLVDAHEQFKMTIGEADKEFNGIMALIQEVQRICQQYSISIGFENPYSYITGQVRRRRQSFVAYYYF